jgi:outer membrane protein assembly factor BamB
MKLKRVVPLVLLLCTGAPRLYADVAWKQWGGPHGDFTCDVTELADKWREDGPAEVWSREIGPGHSTILYEEGVLYTMCRRGEQDAVLAVNAATGETIWEHRYDAPPEPGMLLDYGVGPHSSPLLVGDRLFTIGAMVHFNCLDKRTGTVLWSRHLSKELGVSNLLRGYGSSPIAYRDLVLVNVGGGRDAAEPAGLAAFKQDSGEVAWKSEPLSPGYPTPVLVDFNGQDMLIDCLGLSRFGLDPATGKILWKARVDRQSASIITSPLWIPPDKVLFSAGHGGGTRLYQIRATEDGTFAADQLWYYNRLRIMHANAVRIDDHVYGSSGDLGPAYLMAVDLKTGELKWRARGFSKATLLLAGNKLIILDEDGTLGLAAATPEKLTVQAKAKVLEKYAWTVPTLIDTRLYLRDDRTLKCLDLGVAANK